MSLPSAWEWVFIAVLALLVFGPDKLPRLARSLGETVSRFKREAQSTMDELKRAADISDVREIGRELRTTGDELRKQAALSGPVASSARAVSAGDTKPPPQAATPPPFDPHAT